MTFTQLSMPIFEKAINDYHVNDNVDTPINNPYAERSIEYYLYLKNWIDTVQWHLEDIRKLILLRLWPSSAGLIRVIRIEQILLK